MATTEVQMDRAVQARAQAASQRLVTLGQKEEELLAMLQDVRQQREAAENELRFCEAGGRPKQKAVRHGEATWRRIVRELGVFSTGELATELGVSNQTASKHIAELVEAGILQPAGRVLGRPVFEYVKPTDPGAAFEGQQKHRRLHVVEPVPDIAVSRGAVAGTGRSGDLFGGIKNTEVRAVVKRAMLKGWELRRTGTNHFQLVKPGYKPVGVPGTTANRNAARNVEQKLAKPERAS